ncbi:hypothetical protein CEP52_017117 [Fusarium oligoseptatum]|uniref:Uncharacterized protein n=1 Tax=Fusarium oligoseptatum TaxID=2604345 RepID=A0A428RW73_9HYPO|nr:hypothetical protein CEP52_017117 [Fusarium oligoseptatum]
MDMVQVYDLDISLVEKMRRLTPPDDLQFSRRMRDWDEYRFSQELKDFFDSFKKFHGAFIKERLPARQAPKEFKVKNLMQFLANGGFSVRPNTLVVLIPLFNSSEFAKFRTGTGEWHTLRWVPGTFIRIPSGTGGRDVDFNDPVPVYSLMIEVTLEAASV